MTLEAGTPIGKYVIKRKLAEGGMAEIYLATAMGPEGFEKEVVIKRVRSFLSDDEGFVQMFIAEARLASRLNHANVVQIFDFDKHEDSYYLAMEYVRGCSLWELRKRCREKGVRVPPVLVAHIGAQVAAGLSYAHRARSPDGESLHLVHRDVTPHNVLLSLDGAVKLTDFGIAKAGNKLTQPGVLKGKFAYMSPEQARGEEVDARTDVFALGVVLWEMLTGGRLFDGDSELAVLRAVQESVIAPPARLNPDVPEELDEVVSIALERDPEVRYQSAGEMERALAQCVLRHATSVDDTDVGTFVRRILDAPLTQFIQAPASLQERSRSRSGNTPVTPGSSVRAKRADSTTQAPANTQALGPVRQSTAVMPGADPSLGRDRPVRTDTSDESLVSASTLVLSRDEPPSPRSTSTAVQAAPQMTPTVASAQESAGAKPGGKGLKVGLGVMALVLVGGAVALVLPSNEPAPVAPSSVPATPTPGASAQVSPRQTPASTPSEAEVPVAPPKDVTASPGGNAEVPVPPPASGSAVADVPEVGVAATAPAAQANGILTVKAMPYADVYIDGKLFKRELQRPMDIPLAPGPHQLLFKHPSRSQGFEVVITPNGRVTKSFIVPRR